MNDRRNDYRGPDLLTMASPVVLRPVTADDLPRLLMLFDDREACGDWLWFGFQPQQARRLRTR